jgi:hypothetical protein
MAHAGAVESEGFKVIGRLFLKNSHRLKRSYATRASFKICFDGSLWP